MSSLSAFANPATYHILSYGTLLGSTLYQSFISGIIAFRVLPRPQFSVLQANTFPYYFLLQTVTPALLLLTHPAGPSNLLLNALSSPSTQALSRNLILTMFVAGLINWAYVGPQTTKCMRERKHQETRDGKKSYDAGPHSAEMQRLNKMFGMLHGVSSLVNLIGLIGMIWYAGVLGQDLTR